MPRFGSTIAALILGMLVFHAYGENLTYAFQLDDLDGVVTNAWLRLDSFGEIFWSQPLRALPNYTLALNYRLGELDPTGYHLFNNFVHFAAGLAVFFFVYQLATALSTTAAEADYRPFYIGFVAAALFVSHPIQTQAVTYIIQRQASMAALFYILSLASDLFLVFGSLCLRRV